MSRPHITIAQSMAVVLYVGFGFAALRNADDFWASTTLTVAIITVSAALVGAITRKGKARVTWTGFAVFGWACVIIWLSPTVSSTGLGRQQVTPLLMTWGFNRLRHYIQPMPSNVLVLAYYEQVSRSLEIMILGLVGAVLGRLLVVKDDRPTP
jgi:hypothetical protein